MDFLDLYGADLHSHLGGARPSASSTQSLPASFELLTKIRHTSTGEITVTAANYGVFERWLRMNQDNGDFQFNVHKVASKQPMSAVFWFKHGGKADFEARQALEQLNNHCALLLGCTASIKVFTSEDHQAPVQLVIQPAHSGHTPGSSWEDPILKLHPR